MAPDQTLDPLQLTPKLNGTQCPLITPACFSYQYHTHARFTFAFAFHVTAALIGQSLQPITSLCHRRAGRAVPIGEDDVLGTRARALHRQLQDVARRIIGCQAVGCYGEVLLESDIVSWVGRKGVTTILHSVDFCGVVPLHSQIV